MGQKIEISTCLANCLISGATSRKLSRKMYFELDRNIPNHENWEASFYERLTEYGAWDSNAFWRLHRDLLEIGKNVVETEDVDRNLAYKLIFIQQRIHTLICAHFNSNDNF